MLVVIVRCLIHVPYEGEKKNPSIVLISLSKMHGREIKPNSHSLILLYNPRKLD